MFLAPIAREEAVIILEPNNDYSGYTSPAWNDPTLHCKVDLDWKMIDQTVRLYLSPISLSDETWPMEPSSWCDRRKTADLRASLKSLHTAILRYLQRRLQRLFLTWWPIQFITSCRFHFLLEWELLGKPVRLIDGKRKYDPKILIDRRLSLVMVPRTIGTINPWDVQLGVQAADCTLSLSLVIHQCSTGPWFGWWCAMASTFARLRLS